MANFRGNRINEELKREISEILQNEIKDPGLGMVSIVLCDVSRDLSVDKIYYSVLGDDAQVQSTKEAIKRSSGFTRGEASRRLSLRHTPELVFIYDDSIEHGIKIAKIINEEKAKRGKNHEDE